MKFQRNIHYFGNAVHRKYVLCSKKHAQRKERERESVRN